MADVGGGMFGRDSDSESSEKAEDVVGEATPSTEENTAPTGGGAAGGFLGQSESSVAHPPDTMGSNCQRAARRLRMGTGSVPACRFYAKGKCTRGADCPFRHASVASGASTDAASSFTDAAAAAAAGRATPEQLQQQQRDPTTTLFGDPALAAHLNRALLAQWRCANNQRLLTHGFHPRLAPMNPLTIEHLLRAIPAGPVHDPFVGAGASVVEAMRLGRAATGTDVSPLAVGIARCQTWLASEAELEELGEGVAAAVAGLEELGDAVDWDAAHAVLSAVLTGHLAPLLPSSPPSVSSLPPLVPISRSVSRPVSRPVAHALLYLLSYIEHDAWAFHPSAVEGGGAAGGKPAIGGGGGKGVGSGEEVEEGGTESGTEGGERESRTESSGGVDSVAERGEGGAGWEAF